jgi:hypothetical protein
MDFEDDQEVCGFTYINGMIQTDFEVMTATAILDFNPNDYNRSVVRFEMSKQDFLSQKYLVFLTAYLEDRQEPVFLFTFCDYLSDGVRHFARAREDDDVDNDYNDMEIQYDDDSLGLDSPCINGSGMEPIMTNFGLARLNEVEDLTILNERDRETNDVWIYHVETSVILDRD